MSSKFSRHVGNKLPLEKGNTRALLILVTGLPVLGVVMPVFIFQTAAMYGLVDRLVLGSGIVTVSFAGIQLDQIFKRE